MSNPYSTQVHGDLGAGDDGRPAVSPGCRPDGAGPGWSWYAHRDHPCTLKGHVGYVLLRGRRL